MVKLKDYFPIDIPFNKVGWFYGVIYYFLKQLYFFNKLYLLLKFTIMNTFQMNVSTSADGLINMYTGKDNIEKVGLVNSVNYNAKLNMYNKDCSYSNASAGDLWPEHTAVQPNMSIYIPSLCR